MDNRKRDGSLTEFAMTHHAILFCILFLMMMLSSCSHIAKKDGPPNFYVDETKIPNATPKAEPLAKFGNMSAYNVFGKRYYTMKSSKNYEEVGIASWYGTQFHAHRTSSGEPYNMLAMTAAHKTLPLPTYVEVTNLRNHRKIIVKVNDRGPFESNRLIDLSYVAAKKLGMLGKGTAYVKVKSIDPTEHSNTVFIAKNIRTIKTNYQLPIKHRKQQNVQLVYLQVGAFRSKSHAEQLKSKLSSLLDTTVKISHSSDKGKLYRVKIGPFKDITTVNKMSHRLKVLGIHPNKVYGV